MGSLEEVKLPAMKPIKVVVAEKMVGLEDEPLSPMALMFHKPDSNVCIITILGSKCRVDPEHLKSNLVQFVLSHPRLYSLQVEDAERGGMKWVVQTEVDLHKHVISQDINPSTLIANSPENYLENYLYNLSQTKIDMSKPLWEIHILNGLKTSIDTESVAIVRMHHSLGDGMSLMSLMLALARKTSDDKPLIMTKAEDDKNSITEKLLKKRSDSCIYKRLEGFRNGWRLIWNTFVDVLLFLATVFFLKDTKNPITAPADVGDDTPKRIIVYRTVSLDDIKLVARATKTTVNDVVMGVTEAGLSRYLNRRYGELRSSDGEEQLDVSESSSVVNLPRNMRMRVAVFFNIRVLAGFHVMEEMKEKGSLARWGNQIGYVVYPLKVGIRSNPVEYVLSAKAGMDRKKTSLESRFSYFFIKIILKLFGIESTRTITSSNLRTFKVHATTSSIGVHTRAKTLTLKSLHTTNTPVNSSSYLQLRSRKLQKPPPRRKKLNQVVADDTNRNGKNSNGQWVSSRLRRSSSDSKARSFSHCELDEIGCRKLDSVGDEEVMRS